VATHKLILDVDTGVDDALALGYAVHNPEIDLLAVTTLAGNIDVINATENTRRVMQFVGGADVPIHQGASRPVARAHRDAAHYHGQNGLGDAQLPESRIELGPDRGPAAIIRLVRQFPGEVTVVAVGPLTNIAIALNVFPELANQVKRLVIMGGAYTVSGNVTPHAEFNVWADPEAAQQVFATTFTEAFAVGVDVSHQTPLVRSSWQEAQDIQSPLPQLVRHVCHRSFAIRGQADFPLHDPLATAVAVDPSLVTCKRATVNVVLSGPEEGKTLFSPSPEGNWNVAVGVDASRFVNHFLRQFGLSEDAV
jgi:inosine-uridine nucleoside N-ribohydrolase